MHRALVAFVTKACALALVASILEAGCGKAIVETSLPCPDDGGASDGALSDGAVEKDGSVIDAPNDATCTAGPCCLGGKLANPITTCASKSEYQCTTSACGGV